MKKFFTFALVCCLVFSSSSIAFASQTQWDTSDRTLLTNIEKTLTSTATGTLLRSVNAILTALTSSTQQGSLYNGVAYLYDIRAALTGNNTGVGSTLSTISTTLGNIWSALSFAVDGQYISAFVARIMNAVESFDTDLTSLNDALTRKNSNWGSTRYTNAHSYLINDQGTYSFTIFNSNGTFSQVTVPWGNGTPLGNVAYLVYQFNNSVQRFNSYLVTNLLQGSTSNQNVINWGSLGNSTFTPSSAVDGIYKYLNSIQAPVARLAYVLANDQEIAARNAAAANQTAVVDNFIDPSGSGALPTSSIGSVSDMSDSFKDNFSTDASPTGLFDIFNSDHGSWFSQETADQLDTTNINTRSLKAAPSEDFETPLLDQQIDDIYNALGVKK